MCEYAKDNICTVNNGICPFVYWCDKLQIWRANKYMPTNCKMKPNTVRHKGKYQVKDCRKGFLYVDIDGAIYKILNPFDFVPDYVDVQKREGKFQIKK